MKAQFNIEQTATVFKLLYDDEYRIKITNAITNHAITLEEAIYYGDNVFFEFICKLIDRGYKKNYIEKQFAKLLELHKEDL